MIYIDTDLVKSVLTQGGTNYKYTVYFEKQSGETRSITGILVKPIEGPLGDNVVLLTVEGYKSFNPRKVLGIS